MSSDRGDRLRFRDIRSTSPFRLSLMFGLLVVAGILVALMASYVLTAHELTARSDRILRARINLLLATPPAELPARVEAYIAYSVDGIGYFALESHEGDPVAGNMRMPQLPAPGRPLDLPETATHGPIRVITARTANGETIIVGRDITQIRDLRQRLLLILLASGLASAVVTLAAALLLSRRPLRRVRDLQRTSRDIAAGDLAARMPVTGRRDELDQFAVTVNLMVEEVGHVIAQVKSATDAIAHDLRTPLTRVRASLHRARQQEGLVPEKAAILDRAIEDLDAVIGRFAALLRISELEASGRRAGLARINLAPLLGDVTELYEPLAEERGIVLIRSADALPEIEADRELMFEALANLVDNAIKFATSRVLVRAVSGEAGTFLEVIDDGPGIPDDEKSAVTRRFHRAQGASGVEGTGLGLAVVSAILHLHGFTLELTDASPGLIARVRVAPQPR